MNDWKRIPLLALAAAALLLTAAAGAAPAEEAAPPETDTLLQAIRTTDDARTAIAAYAKANTRDPDNIELHQAHLRRMLELGLPQVAIHPARALVRLGARDAKAWGVIAYHHGRAEEYTAAFDAAARAAALEPDNPSLLANLAQLLVWYDRQVDVPPVSPAALRAVERHRPQWERHAAFTAATARMEKAYESTVGLRERLRADLTALDLQLQAIRREGAVIQQQVQAIDRELYTLRARIDELEDEKYYSGGGIYRGPGGVIIRRPYRRWGHRGPVVSPYRLREIEDEIDEIEDAIDALQLDRRVVVARGVALLGELRENEQLAEQLSAQLARTDERPEAFFRWDPPAVDGQVVERREYVPARRSDPEPRAPAQEARARLDLARAYFHAARYDRARSILLDLLRTWPHTPEAVDAEILLVRTDRRLAQLERERQERERQEREQDARPPVDLEYRLE